MAGPGILKMRCELGDSSGRFEETVANFTSRGIGKRAKSLINLRWRVDLFRNIPLLIMTDLGMISLTGWNFVLPLWRYDPALPIIVVDALTLKLAQGICRIATAFAQMLRDFDTLSIASQELSVEFGAVQPVVQVQA